MLCYHACAPSLQALAVIDRRAWLPASSSFLLPYSFSPLPNFLYLYTLKQPEWLQISHWQTE